MIYFDNAATTINKPKEVIDAVSYAMMNFGNANRGLYEQSLKSSNVIYDTRIKLSKFFNSSDYRKVIFTSNSTEALNVAIKGILKKGDHVITTELEHNSVLRPLYEKETEGVEISYLKIDKYGNINYDDLKKLLKDNTKLVVTTHGSNVLGNLLNVKEIGNFCKNNNLIYIVDASQTAGEVEIDMTDMNIDILCFTGHKSLFGPQGTGGLILNREIDIKNMKSGGTGIKTFDKFQPKVFPTYLEAGTLNSHGICGINASIDYINKIGIKKIKEKNEMLTKYFYDKIRGIEGIKIYGDFTNFNRCPIVSINLLGYDSAKISDYLYEKYEIATRPQGHCAPLVHKSFKTEKQGMVRFSFSYNNNIYEIDTAVNALKNILN